MKFDIKTSTALAVGGITIAVAFLLTAIVSPSSLDWILHPSDERSDRIKKVMERQKGTDADGRSDAPPGREEEKKSGAISTTPLPEESVHARGGDIRADERISKPECISRDQVIKVIGASEEAREGRVIGISVAQDGNRRLLAERKVAHSVS